MTTDENTKKKVTIYDTTLRDGTQGEGVNFSSLDKLRIAEKLDDFKVDYIEGGWPGSNPKDVEFFAEAAKRDWRHAKVALLAARGARTQTVTVHGARGPDAPARIGHSALVARPRADSKRLASNGGDEMMKTRVSGALTFAGVLLAATGIGCSMDDEGSTPWNLPVVAVWSADTTPTVADFSCLSQRSTPAAGDDHALALGVTPFGAPPTVRIPGMQVQVFLDDRPQADDACSAPCIAVTADATGVATATVPRQAPLAYRVLPVDSGTPSTSFVRTVEFGFVPPEDGELEWFNTVTLEILQGLVASAQNTFDATRGVLSGRSLDCNDQPVAGGWLRVFDAAGDGNRGSHQRRTDRLLRWGAPAGRRPDPRHHCLRRPVGGGQYPARSRSAGAVGPARRDRRTAASGVRIRGVLRGVADGGGASTAAQRRRWCLWCGAAGPKSATVTVLSRRTVCRQTRLNGDVDVIER